MAGSEGAQWGVLPYYAPYYVPCALYTVPAPPGCWCERTRRAAICTCRSRSTATPLVQVHQSVALTHLVITGAAVNLG